jgi:SAM-dependent methyltransferase/acyl carrier protein
MGYDGGEYVAGCVAGVFSLEDGARLASASRSPKFADVAASVVFVPPSVPVVSHISGAFATGEQIATPAFWQHAGGAARVKEGIETLWNASYRVFVEIGHAEVAEEARLTVDRAAAASWLQPLGDGAGWQPMLDSLIALHVAGVTIDWTRFDQDYARRKLALPTYPFQRQRYWVETGQPARAARTAGDLDLVVAAGTRQSQEGPLDLNLHSFAGKWRCLERLTTAYIIQALRGIGVFVAPGERHTADELVEQLGVLPAYRKLVGRWFDRLEREGLLRKDAEAFVGVTPLPDPEVASVWRESTDLADVPFLIDYITRCGTGLQRVITGAESPLETLFPGGSVDIAEQLYERSAASRYINGISRAVTAAHVRARGGKVNVIEIGAGTGATTSAVLPALPHASTNYWFTDVSEFFLRRAETKFRDYTCVRYGLLDIEKTPDSQGYPARLFDVVVAANALHATSNVRRTLDHARSLLAPGGILVLAEDTVYHSFFDITIALIEGWQRFEDNIRGDHPLLSIEQWREALSEAGFDRVVAFPDAGSPAEVIGQTVFVARSPLTAAAAGAMSAEAWSTEIERRRAGLAGASPDAAESEPLARRVSEALPAEREELLIEYVRDHVAGVLRLDPTALPERRQRLMDLGLDSLMAVELRNRLASGVGTAIALPATLMFDYPTIEAIAEFLGRQLVDSNAPASGAATDSTGSDALNEAAARLADVSEEEAEALLIQRLESL